MRDEADMAPSKIEKPAVAQVTPDELTINIPTVEVQNGYLGKIALYKLVTEDKDSNKSYTRLKRYNHFVDLAFKLKDKYKGTHMVR